MRGRKLGLGWMAGAVAAVLACEPATGPAPVATVVVAPNSITLASGADTNLTASVLGPSGAPLEGREVLWQSNDPTLVSVTGTGGASAAFVLTASPRFTTVTASSGGRTGQAVVTVLPSPPDTLVLTPLIDALEDGDAVQIPTRVVDAFGNELVNRFIAWTSRDTTVARVNSAGVVTPVPFLGGGPREVTVVAAIEGLSDSITVTVLPTSVTSIEIVPGAAYLRPGWTKRLRIDGITAEGSRIPGLIPTWQSLNVNVATVGNDGLTTAVDLGGTSIVANLSGLEDTLSVDVNPCGNGPAGDFDLEIRFFGDAPPQEVQQAFDCAAARLRGIIVGQLSAVDLDETQFGNRCVTGVVVDEIITGLLILARVDSIDGPGQVLGSAGPCYVRTSNSLPILGGMLFDEADLAGLAVQGRLDDVILHEMLHVIGVGTIWNTLDLIEGVAQQNPRFTGALAREACVNDHGGVNACATAVPVEDCEAEDLPPGTVCGQGTINVHWKESVFASELMTGYLDAGTNPFSRMTVQSLADMGYTVDNTQDNDYQLSPGQALRAVDSWAPRGLKMPIPTPPIGAVDDRGRFTPIPRR